MSPRAIALIGECMVELSASRQYPGHYERRYGGDTLNTAVYLARLLAGRGIAVSYVTRLGDDALSRWMIAGWQAEGIDCRLVETVKGSLPGLYMIDTDEKGERSFTYWRGEAPVRELFARNDDPLLDGLAEADALYTSGITLAVLSGRGREALIALMRRRKQAGAIIAFDTNFRARLWPDAEAARPWFEAAIGAATIAMPSSEDLASIFATTLSAEEWLHRLSAMGAGEIVLKAGGEAVWTWAGGCAHRIALARSDNPLDTTGAGDSFNAGYLAARLRAEHVRSSVEAAHRLASRVIQFPGAIIPREEMASPRWFPTRDLSGHSSHR
jgi:2-dehydro-3-deoxygluconokinase